MNFKKDTAHVAPNRFIIGCVERLAGGTGEDYGRAETLHDALFWASEADFRIDYASEDMPYLMEHLRYVIERAQEGGEDVERLLEIERGLEQSCEMLPSFVLETLAKIRTVSDYYFWRAILGLLRCVCR